MTDYNTKSDAEINELVAIKRETYIEPMEGDEIEVIGGVKHFYDRARYLHACTPDYCNNPSDAWPIILENGIGLITGRSNPRAFVGGNTKINDSVSAHEALNGGATNNVLRAAMIVYLMMEGE